MNRMAYRCAMAAVLAGLLAAGGTASAFPDIPCTEANTGQQVSTPTSQGYDVWECDGTQWRIYLRYICDRQGLCYPL